MARKTVNVDNEGPAVDGSASYDNFDYDPIAQVYQRPDASQTQGGGPSGTPGGVASNGPLGNDPVGGGTPAGGGGAGNGAGSGDTPTSLADDAPRHGGSVMAGNFGNHFVNMQAYLNANQGGTLQGGMYGHDLLRGGEAGALPPNLSGLGPSNNGQGTQIPTTTPTPAAAPDPNAPAAPPQVGNPNYAHSGNYTSGMSGVDQMLYQGFSGEPPRHAVPHSTNTPTPPADAPDPVAAPTPGRDPAPDPASQPFTGMNNALAAQSGSSVTPQATSDASPAAATGGSSDLGLGGFTTALNSGAAAGGAPNTTAPTANTPGQEPAQEQAPNTTTPTSTAPASAEPASPAPRPAQEPKQEDMKPGTPLRQYAPPTRFTRKSSSFDEMYDRLSP